MVFAGTDSGLYRLEAGVWKRLLADVSGSIYSLAVSEDSLYVSTGPDFRKFPQIRSKPAKVAQAMSDNNSSGSRVFHSADFGASWTEITPMGGSRPIITPFGMSLSVVGKTILAQADTLVPSRDGGQTWVDLEFEANSSVFNTFPSVAVSERIPFTKRVRLVSIEQRMPVNRGICLWTGWSGTGILDLVAVSNRLYVHTDGEIVQSTDRGESWEAVGIDVSKVNPKPFKEGDSRFNFSGHSRLTIADNILYVITPQKRSSRVFRLSTDGNALIPVQAVPAFEVEQGHLSEVPETGDDLPTPDRI